MLTLTIFLPLATGLVVLLLPSRRLLLRGVALAGAALTFLFALSLWSGYFASRGGMQWIQRTPWIPAFNAYYFVAVDGLSLALIVLTSLLLLMVNLYVLRQGDRTKAHAFLFLLMATGLMGVFSARDLLLFYLFFEVALVPMYFIVGAWGHENRRYAAMKFFLYTRAGSLAMLLSFLALYLASTPHSFALPDIIASRPFAAAAPAGGLVLLGLLIGFGVKLPTFPLHNWLPDAHVEAPTEGSVVLAGLQLKMGGYGLLRVALPTLPDAVAEYAWVLVGLGIVSLIYGALAALAQSDLKRLVAYTSINHMGYVSLACGIWGLTSDPAVRQLALTGAGYQMISHGLLTGGMFFVAGWLGEEAGTRDIRRFGGLVHKLPVFSAVTIVLSFASLGLPGFSGFIAEFQVIGATVSVSVVGAALVVLGLIITTGLYLRIVMEVLLGKPGEATESLRPPLGYRVAPIVILAACSLLLGILPAILVSLLSGQLPVQAGIGG